MSHDNSLHGGQAGKTKNTGSEGGGNDWRSSFVRTAIIRTYENPPAWNYRNISHDNLKVSYDNFPPRPWQLSASAAPGCLLAAQGHSARLPR